MPGENHVRIQSEAFRSPCRRFTDREQDSLRGSTRMTPRNLHPRAQQPDASGIHVLGPSPYAYQETQAEQLQSLGLRTAGVAHDFNNLLGVVLGYCTLLRGQTDLADAGRTMIAEIANAAETAQSLARGLLATCGGNPLPPLALDWNQCIRSMKPTLLQVLGSPIEVTERLGKSLALVEARPGELEQILMNLAINARDAMPGGGKLTIETASHGDADCHVRLKVTDTGIGMDAGTQARIFDPFFTTKRQGRGQGQSRGMGLGLSTVCSIVKKCNGTIAVHSNPGCGTTFTIDLPRWQERESLPGKTAGMRLAGDTVRVLLVEDVRPLRELTCRMLEGAGYAVLSAATAREALRLSQTCTARIPLLITDIAMPGLSGFELAQRLAVCRPETRVLFTSGSPLHTLRQTALPSTNRLFLQKPFTREKLLESIDSLLHPSLRSNPERKFSPASAYLAPTSHLQKIR